MQGKWTLTEFINNEGKIDVAKGTWELNDKGKAKKQATEELYQGIIAQAKGAVLIIKGEVASQSVLGKDFEASFALENKDGKTFMTMDDGTSGSPQVYIKDGKMHIIDTAEDIDMHMVYSPVK
jgi:hypothetical protein